MESIVIPKNYTDAGKIFGMFELRNVVECVLICIPTVLLTLLLTPFGLTITLIVCLVIVIPLGGFALLGVHDYSLFTFIYLYHRWRKNRRILNYRGTVWIKRK